MTYMTDTAAAAESVLGTFEGRDVLAAGIELPSAAGGLRDALAVEPRLIELDDETFIVFQTKAVKIRFEEIKDTDGLRRVAVLSVENATFIEGEVVEQALADQAERIRLAKEAAAGIQRIDFGGDGTGEDGSDEEDVEAVMVRQHNTGSHADGLRDGCPLCADEADLERIGK